MSAVIYEFPECGMRTGERREPLAGLVFNRARFERLLPLTDADAGYIIANATSSDPTTKHRAGELFACAVALRPFKGHPQGETARRILAAVFAAAGRNAGPAAA